MTVDYLARSCTISMLFRSVLMDKADVDEVRTKELICKLIVPNQFYALVPLTTKGFGQRDLDKESLDPLERPRPRHDNITGCLTLYWSKVNKGGLISRQRA